MALYNQSINLMGIFQIPSSFENRRYTREDVIAAFGFNDKTLKALIDAGIFPRPMQGSRKQLWEGSTLACWAHISPMLNIIMSDIKGRKSGDEDDE